MINRMTLGHYLARQYLLWFGVFLGTLASIIYLFEVAELARRAAHSDTPFSMLLRMGLYKLPETVEHVLPFVVLFAGMFTFWRLTRSQELTIARAVGLSAWQFLAPALMVTLIFGGLNLSIINPLGAHFSSRYKQLEMRYLEHAPLMELTGAGLWLRQRDNDHRYLIHADHVTQGPMTLTPVIVFIFDTDDHYQGRIDAPSAVLRDGYWEMDSGWMNMDQQAQQAVEHYHLATTLTLDKIQESMAPPNTISFWELP
ncbi:MAG: LptF/LptG family permease, partial [Alphaproteobacteria bacterium]|nr:LptF/LptG family permease [Alphaproteobacteria bacterium]